MLRGERGDLRVEQSVLVEGVCRAGFEGSLTVCERLSEGIKLVLLLGDLHFKLVLVKFYLDDLVADLFDRTVGNFEGFFSLACSIGVLVGELLQLLFGLI